MRSYRTLEFEELEDFEPFPRNGLIIYPVRIGSCCNLSLCTILKGTNLLLVLSLLASPNCPSFQLHFPLDFALVQVSLECFLKINFN